MNLPVDVHIDDYREAAKTKDSITLGHYFAFVDAKEEPRRGRMRRLLAEPTTTHRVLPLVGDPIAVTGMTLTPKERRLDPLGAVVADRDLYRAEHDTVYLFVAMPQPPKDLELQVHCNGELLTERPVELQDGVGIETLSMLLPGSYRAQLAVHGRKIGTPVEFTVATYTLAPLSGRLVSHELDRNNAELRFTLAVESYQVPFDGELEVSLVDDHVAVASTRLEAEAPGRYAGRLAMLGDGPFRLQLASTVDAERVAQVAIPGSRAAERDVTVIGELGRQRLFSMMPEPGALPLRGGFLTEGDFLATPLVVEEVVSDTFTLHAKKDLESLQLVVLDLSSGDLRVVDHGTAKAGEKIPVDTESTLCTVFAGCVVDGQPFEGYGSFIRPSRLALEIDVPETLRPGQDLVVQLSLNGAAETTPVLVAVRDQRLTATDRPSVRLGASAKNSIAHATEGMDEGFFENDWILPPRLAAMAPSPAWFSRGRDPRFASEAPFAETALYDSEEADDTVLDDTGSFIAMSPPSPSPEPAPPAPEPPRSDFPEVLFYGVVHVDRSQEVVIPLRDTLGTFAVEAFTLVGSDWTDARTSVVVDQPVRVDLELPPSVHANDVVAGRLRAATSSGRGKITVTRDGESLSLRGTNGDVLETPVELELDVVPGTYVARVEDAESGETDMVELIVSEPGVSKSYVKELGLLLAGDHITLDSADALTLRMLPAVEEPLDTLITATASYAHLCCEQTAAKILAATFMYLTGKSDGTRRDAEQIILAGIEREKKMLRPGRGLAMYPDARDANDHWGRAAVRYLWSLDQLEAVPELPPSLRRAAREGLELADTAAEAYGIRRLPETIHSSADAYAAATAGNGAASEQYFTEILDFSGGDVSPRGHADPVQTRATLAYAGASFLAMGRVEKGVRLANQVTRQLNEHGRLYSTHDSVAAIALMIQVRTRKLVSNGGSVRVNGKEMTALEAASLSDQVESLEVLEGVAAVEITRIHEEDWTRFETSFPVRIGFRDDHGHRKSHFRMGERAELVVTLPDGYRVGDLAHVSLPACLSWIHGGGKIKQFTLDFEGRDELRIPLIVTSKIESEQHFALCVRNMFEEERVTMPGLLRVQAQP